MNVFNINNPQDLNNMVWMNNSGNSGLPQITSVTGGGGTNQMILDENSINYFNAQQGAAHMAQQQQALVEMNQMQGQSFMSEFQANSTAISSANDIFALQQQHMQLQQQINLAAYGSMGNLMGNIMANNNDMTNEEEEEMSEEEETGENYDEENSSASDFALQQQQLFFLQQQQQAQIHQQQQMIEQNNIQLNDANYFLINNPHLFNNSSTSDDGSSMIIQQNPMQQQIIMTNKQIVSQQTNVGDVSMVQKCNNSKKLKESHKIMPVKRPGLKLKTPIAYFGNTDPSVIPIQKDGMGVCEKCGAIGVKHAFYTKERRFCSLSCARGFEEIAGDQTMTSVKARKQQILHPNYKFKVDQPKEKTEDDNDSVIKIENQQILYQNVMPQEQVPQIMKPTMSGAYEERHQSIRRKMPSEFANSFDWNEIINKEDFFAAPVMNFAHAPGYEVWSDIVVGIKVEVENLDYKDNEHLSVSHVATPFWIATIIKIHGYKAKLRYEGYENDDAHDFWVNLCATEVHPVGWSAMQGRQLIPPMKIEARIKNMKKYLLKSLHHAKTLPGNFYNKLYDSFRSRFETGLILEVVDKNCISRVKLARIMKVVGKRLYVQYFDSSEQDSGFWCHEDSPLIHPVGWATTVGHKLSAPPDYIERMNLARERILDPNDDDATMDLFKLNFLYEEYFDSSRDDKVTAFCEGMKLEAIDPLNLSSICVATVMEVLKFGYMMIRIDSYAPDATGSDWFCYHEKSPCIFPVGFCKANGIPLTPPNGYNRNTFNWNSYLAEKKSIPAMDQVFHRFSSNHGCKMGMKLECADLMDPRLVCVATISRVVGRLLKIHFDGWEEEYDQWLDCESPDIYPVGWCVTVGHKLEGPPSANSGKTQMMPAKILPRGSTKKQSKKGPKRKSGGKEHYVIASSGGQKQFHASSSSASTSMPSLPITFIKQDTNDSNEYGSYTIKPTSHHPPQNLFGGSLIKAESSEKSIINNISNFKNLQKNLELIEQQHVFRTQGQRYVGDDSEEDDDPNGGLQYEEDEEDDITLSPLEWDCNDVLEFLKRSNCSQHCELFMKHKIDGKKLLQLRQNEIIQLLGMKVGPAIKVFDLIQQIKAKVAPFMNTVGMK